MHPILIVVCISVYLTVSTSADVVIYTSNGYQLTIINNDANFSQDTRQRFINTYFAVMPQMCARFNRNCSHEVNLQMDPSYNGVAYTSGITITASLAWFQNNPQDTDVLTHECMHVVQAYPHYDPVWLIEGIADYARWKYGQNNAAANWALPNFDNSQNYTDSYRVTARFLVWCEERYPRIVNQLDSALRKDIYQAATWKRFACGKTIDRLWQDYSKNPAI